MNIVWWLATLYTIAVLCAAVMLTVDLWLRRRDWVRDRDRPRPQEADPDDHR